MATDDIERKLEDRPPSLNKDVEQLEVAADEPLPGDATQAPQFTKPLKEKKRFKERLRALLRSKKFWLITALVLLVALVGAWFIEPSRYWLVNAVGRRATLTVVVQSPADKADQAPAKLKNVNVVVNGREFTSDDQGKIDIRDQPYGQVTIAASKAGYAEASRTFKLDYDPFFHALGGKQSDQDARNIQLDLPAVGIAVSFTAVDYLSGKPLAVGEFNAGDIAIKPNDQGLVAFKAPPNDANKVSIKSNFGGAYTDKTFELQLGATEVTQVVFVPAGRHYFMSNRDGALGIYAANLDGSEPQQVIPGTGREQADTLFAVNASGTMGVLASTRDGERDAQRQPLTRLYLVDLAIKQLTKLDEGYGFEFVGWQSDVLVYKSITSIAANTFEQALRSLDTGSKKLNDITKVRYLGPGVVALDQVVVSVQEDLNKNGLIEFETESTIRRFDLKTNAPRDLLKNSTNLVQTGFDRVAMQTNLNVWKEYNLNTGDVKDMAPPGVTSRYYSNILSPDGSKRLVIDKVDGKFVLLSRNATDGAEKQLYAHGSLTGPLRWLGNNVVVFRIASASETADYAVSLGGGDPKKISDVTASSYQYDYFNGFRSY